MVNRKLFVIVIVVLITAITGCTTLSGPSPLTITVSPASKSVSNGETFSLDVKISGASDFYGFQFNLNYDSNILEFKDAEEGTFLNENGEEDTFFMDPSNPSPGLIKNVICSRKGEVGGVNGDGILATVTFTALSPGTSPINLSNVKLSNSQVQVMQFTTFDGEIVIQ